MTEPSRAVFLSYASQDGEAAKRICEVLRASGIEVWFDQSELRGGDAWDRQIRKQIVDCAFFIPIISAATQSRLEGYFRLEWKLAVDRSHLMAAEKQFLLPIVVDGTTEQSASVPDKFREVQWTRLRAGETPAVFVERVLRLLSPELSAATVVRPAAAAASNRAVAPQYAPASTALTKRIPLVLAALAVIGFGYFVVDTFVLSKRPAAGMQALVAAGPSTVAAQSAIPEKSIAVLPFVDMSEKKEEEYFSDGLSEELIDLLSKTSDLRVPARTSSFYFKGRQTTIADIAEALRVANVLEESVRKSGKTLRVTAQLIRVSDGYHVWSESYDRELKDVFKVQDEIAAAVVSALKARLLPSHTPVTAHRTTNMDAYDEFLAGRQNYAHDTLDGYRRARTAYQRAIALDPSFAAAYAELASAEDLSVAKGDDVAGVPRAFAAAEKAIELAPDLADGYTARGRLRYRRHYDWVGAQADFAKAMTLDPGAGHVYRRYGGLLASLGRLPDAIAAERHAIELDPLSQLAWMNLARYLTDSGEFTAARDAARRALELDRDVPEAQSIRCSIPLYEGNAQEARELAQSLEEESDRLWCIAIAEHNLGHVKESQQALDELIAKEAQVAPYQIAQVLAWSGQKDQAFTWLERAYQQRGLTYVKVDRLLASLRGDPRYKAFLRKMNLPE